MDFNQLIESVGLWPALVLVMGWWIDKLRREQIASLEQEVADREKRIATLETEAMKTLTAKDGELTEWKRIALTSLEKNKGSR